MKKKLLILLNFFIIIQAQKQTTIYESLRTLSPALYDMDSAALDILKGNSSNVTLLLPNIASVNNSIQTGLLNSSNSQSASEAIQYLILKQAMNATQFLENRKYYTTYLNQTQISIGPSDTNPRSIELYSGMIKANIIQSNIQCTNGLIHVVDKFLQPAETPLKTISDLANTNYMEELLKSLNISEIISKNNRTLLVPIDSAWKAINGSTLPFGKILRNFRYMSLQGTYLSNDFYHQSNKNYTTDYKDSFITIGPSLLVNNISRIVETDILTTSGVVHLIDTVVEPPSTKQDGSPDDDSNQQQDQPQSQSEQQQQQQQQTMTSNTYKLSVNTSFLLLCMISLLIL